MMVIDKFGNMLFFRDYQEYMDWFAGKPNKKPEQWTKNTLPYGVE